MLFFRKEILYLIFFYSLNIFAADPEAIVRALENGQPGEEELVVSYQGKYGNYLVFYSGGRDLLFLKYRDHRFDYRNDHLVFFPGVDYRVKFNFQRKSDTLPPRIELPPPEMKTDEEKALQAERELHNRTVRDAKDIYLGLYISHSEAVIEQLRF